MREWENERMREREREREGERERMRTGQQRRAAYILFCMYYSHAHCGRGSSCWHAQWTFFFAINITKRCILPRQEWCASDGRCLYGRRYARWWPRYRRYSVWRWWGRRGRRGRHGFFGFFCDCSPCVRLRCLCSSLVLIFSNVSTIPRPPLLAFSSSSSPCVLDATIVPGSPGQWVVYIYIYEQIYKHFFKK